MYSINHRSILEQPPPAITMSSSDIKIENYYSMTLEDFQEMEEITIEPVEIDERDDGTEMHWERLWLQMNSEPRDTNIPIEMRIYLNEVEICPSCKFPYKEPTYVTRQYRKHQELHNTRCPTRRRIKIYQ